jgi:Holliday junction resolvase RusA-like endonuclease
MKQTFIKLAGEPRSTSHIYHYHCQGGFPKGYMNAVGKALKIDYQWQAKSQWKGKMVDEPLTVSMELFFGTKRKQDVDNYNKLVLDALTGIVWQDDSQIKSLTITKNYDKANPRVELTISI